MGQDVEKWVRKAQEGSRRAFDKLVLRYIKRIFRLLYDITGNYEDAQDLTQEAFLRAFLNIRGYRGDAKFHTWLYRIAYNVGIDFERRSRRLSRVEWDSQRQKRTVGPFDPAKNGEYTGEREAIEAALQTLTQPQRLSVVLFYYHGFRMREIGEILGCSEGTARVHLFRALRRLRKELRDYSPRV